MAKNAQQTIGLAVADFLTLNVGWLLFNVVRFYTLPAFIPESLWEFLQFRSLLWEQALIPLFMMALYALSGVYNPGGYFFRSRVDDTTNAAIVSFIGSLCIYIAVLANDPIPERMTIFELVVSLWISLAVPTIIVRLVINTRRNNSLRRSGKGMRTIAVGISEKNLPKLQRIISSSHHSGLIFEACIDNEGSFQRDFAGKLPVIKSHDIAKVCRDLKADAVVVLPPDSDLHRTAGLITDLYPLDVPVYITPEVLNLMAVRPKVSSIIDEPIIDITHARLSPLAVNLKRIADIIVSVIALILLLPVFAVLAIAVKLDSRGPVFFRQTRLGYHKKPFKIIKFRTMRPDAEQSGPALSSPNDSRITPLGRFLRKYRIDELPQFWNVLVGEMSLVGPRPEREFYIRRIQSRVPSYSLIHQVRPGITSWGMVKYGYASNVEEMIERLPYDLLYIENLSLGVDLKILFHTVKTILTGKGM